MKAFLIMTNSGDDNISRILLDSLLLTSDGVGLFDKNDMMVYCNEPMAKLFGLSAKTAQGKHFSALISACFNSVNGVNVQAENLEDWLEIAYKKRRSRPFRSFETDTQNGNWYQITEQIVDDDYLYIYSTDITEKKKNQQALEAISQQLLSLASTDFLTSINNRRSFCEQAEIEMERCKRHQQKLSLLLIDLDYFKQINDQYGHAAGDAVLKSFTDCVIELLRKYDIFGRLGGDEFAIILPNTDKNESMAIAQRIRTNIEKMHVEYKSHHLKIEVSMGLAKYTNDLKSIDDLILVADKNLYQAKAEGRNKIVGG